TAIIDVILISQVLSVVGIKLNECNSKRDFEKANGIIKMTSNGLVMLLLPIVTIGVLYSDEILHLLFKQSFEGVALANMNLSLKWLFLLVPLAMFNSLFTRLLAALQLLRKIVWPSFITHIICLLLAFLFIRYLGFPGYFYSQLSGYILLMILFYVLIKARVPSIQLNDVFLFLVKQVVINAAFGILLWQLNEVYFSMGGIVLLFFSFFMQCVFVLLFNFKNPLVARFTQYLVGVARPKNT
ncbi:MAG: lipid II flippase MurJ, partial [Chitinophagaceae bacterium]